MTLPTTVMPRPNIAMPGSNIAMPGSKIATPGSNIVMARLVRATPASTGPRPDAA
jgi:hypothetical protein